MSGKINAAAIRDNSATNSVEVLNVVQKDVSKSARIRELASMGIDRSTIAQLMDVRYQHVRNVLVTQVTGSKKEAVKMTEEHLAG